MQGRFFTGPMSPLWEEFDMKDIKRRNIELGEVIDELTDQLNYDYNLENKMEEADHLKKHKSALKALKNEHRKQHITRNTSLDLVSFLRVFQLNISTDTQCREITKDISDLISASNTKTTTSTTTTNAATVPTTSSTPSTSVNSTTTTTTTNNLTNINFIKKVAIQGKSILLDSLQSKLHLTDHDHLPITATIATPIKSHNNRMVGVFQLVNKSRKKYFSHMDLNLMEAVSIFFGLGIYNCQMYEDAVTLMAKRSVAIECLSYHTTASQADTDGLLKLYEERKLVQPYSERDGSGSSSSSNSSGISEISASGNLKLKNTVNLNDTRLFSFQFNDKYMPDIETCLTAMHMFTDTNLNATFHIPLNKLARFVLSVKRNYRQVLYHNWRHALNVAQTMCAMIYAGNMKLYLGQLEILALIVACLCHDLDHRGTNNDFQFKVHSPLAKLYSTSTLEHHHFDQCIMILNSDKNNIFTAIDTLAYKHLIKVIEHAILSTDLKLYFSKKSQFIDLVTSLKTNPSTTNTTTINDTKSLSKLKLKPPPPPPSSSSSKSFWLQESNNQLLRGMMMTACDLAGITKPWEIQKEVAYLVAGEFFEQGDLEKKLDKSVTPLPMMDRSKEKELPKMQIGFIDFVCMPLYKNLAKTFTLLKPMLDGVEENRKNWVRESETDFVYQNGNGMKNADFHDNNSVVKKNVDDTTIHAVKKGDNSHKVKIRKKKEKSKVCNIV